MSPHRYFMLVIRREERARRNEERRYRQECEREYSHALDRVIDRFLRGQLTPLTEIQNLNYWTMRREEMLQRVRRVRKPV